MIPFTIEAQLSHPLHHLYLIEASAGTGKTYTIANLYLRHILAGQRVSQLLVVTFTNAATDELRGRIRTKLYTALRCLESGCLDKAAGLADDPFSRQILKNVTQNTPQKQQAKAYLELAVHSMDEAAIFTIHGFCQRALKEFAFLSGQSFNLELNNNEDELLLPIAKDWWRRSLYAADGLRYQVAKTAWKNDIEVFYRQIKSLLDRDITLASSQTAANQKDITVQFTELAQAFLSSKDEIQTLLREASCLGKRGQYQQKRLSNNIAAVTTWFECASSLEPPKQLHYFGQKYLLSQLKKGADGSQLLQHPLFEQVQNYCDAYPKIFQNTLIQLIDEALQFFKTQGQAIKTETQVLSFNDLLTQLHNALRAESGAALRQVLRERYPIAMIDEFQDTDPIQYGIFKQLYVGQPQQTLYMIGDPKQAIYSFRGGDIYTYLQAKKDVTEHHGTIYTLIYNWRSTPAMLTAVNTIFQHAKQPFLHKDIQFQAITAPAEKTEHKMLRINGKPVTPLSIWLTADAEAKGRSKSVALSKDIARQQIDTAITHYIAALLTLSKTGQVQLGDHNLKPSDIAILVPTHKDAERLREKLSALGVASSTMGKKTVFESPEASILRQLLYAIRHPNDRALLRQALASPLLTYAYHEIYQKCNHEAAWFAWMERFHSLYLQWQAEGFMSMFLSLLAQLNCTYALAQQSDTDRMMSNLLQLGELLQYASKQHSSIDALLTWFDEKCFTPALGGENAELRLESDADTVKLSTLYASKGLEYGMVFLPYLWDLHNVSKKTPIFYHNEEQKLRADMGSPAFEEHLRLADYERLAEQCRLIYVALTRSVACCHLVWGNIGKPPNNGCADNSALGYLLHGQQTAASLKNIQVSSLDKATWTQAQIKVDLAKLLPSASQSLHIAALEQLNISIHADTPAKHSMAAIKNISSIVNASLPEETVSASVSPLKSKTLQRSLANHWRIASFSSLSKNIYHNRLYIEAINQDVILNFPAGKRTGLYLHRLFECLDFQADLTTQVAQLNQRLLPRYGLSLEEHDVNTQHWVSQVVHTPLDQTGLRLLDIPAHKRLNEMEFHFSTNSHKVNMQRLNQLLQQNSVQPLQIITQSNFQGLVNGIIDLIFEYQGRYYLVDYKSNYLGNRLEDYQHETMQTEINTRRYDLQYMLYSLALHRFLQTRQLDYDYKTHFGGVYYLYLRGMRIDQSTGIFFTLPDEEYLEKFNALF